MHPKLQQAIVATRSGRKKDAQHLLIDILRDNPSDADAWYLLSQLVESESRQVSYLEKTVEIDPGHPKAKQRLMQLGAIPVPAPIFSEGHKPSAIVAEDESATSQEAPLQEEISSQESKKSLVESEPVTPQSTRVNKQKSRSENAKVDTEWRRTAGQPVTEKAAQPAKASEPIQTPDKQQDTERTKTNKQTPWLTILLIIILVGILGLFGYWLYVFFFSSF